jgi:acyl-CoA hydrolase
MSGPERPESLEACVEAVLDRIGKRIVLGLPLGLGKPNQFANALYDRAVEDRSLDLTIFTALTLERPRPKSELEARFTTPLGERMFGDYPDLAYAKALRGNTLPDNIKVHEFFMNPGAWLRADRAQQDYISINYTHGSRTLAELGVNVIGQLIAKRSGKGHPRYSLSCNTDVTLDVVAQLRRKPDRPFVLVGQVNSNLPFMPNDAEVPAEYFDFLIDQPKLDFTLFGAPKTPVSAADYAAGFNAASLVRDGGSLQIGIGSLADAIAYALILRHSDTTTYGELMDRLTVDQASLGDDIRLRERSSFERGLYGVSEMVVEPFLDLADAGVLTRKVYDDAILQRLIDEKQISDRPGADALKALLEAKFISSPLDAAAVEKLIGLGLFRKGTKFTRGKLTGPGGERLAPDIATKARRQAVAGACMEARLRGGTLLHGGFFLGSQAFYHRLRTMPDEQLDQINMTAISFINALYGDEPLKATQRRHARFINTAMMVTLTGAVVSDGLADGQVVSGVGGQYNFVAQAHALAGARSIIAVRATRAKAGKTRSNIVWNYGHTTIPRHLRDVFVTEYGIADLRGKSDRDCICAMLKIADSRFQPRLMDEAKGAGKLERDYRIPARYIKNTPQRLNGNLAQARAKGLFPVFPFGTDLTDTEITLGRALRWLKSQAETKRGLAALGLAALWPGTAPTNWLEPLERLNLHDPRSLKEKALARLVTAALEKTKTPSA